MTDIITCGDVDMVTLVSIFPCLSTAVLLAVPRSGGSQQNLQWELGLTSLNMSPKTASFKIFTEHIKILKYGKQRKQELVYNGINLPWSILLGLN